MSEPVRVLQVLGGTSLGGAESRIMDLYRNMDRNKIQFDFAVHNNKEEYYNAEIRALGGSIYRIPRFKGYNVLSYARAWKRFFQEHRGYSAVHGHMTSTASIYLPIAKKSGVPVTIAHARSAGTDPGIKGNVTKLLRRKLYQKADYCFTCSKIAGEAVFGKKRVQAGLVRTIPNAIEVDKYRYDIKIREQIRRTYGLQDKFVIGHVGRFHYAKNHAFLLDVFAEVSKQMENTRLLLLGEGGLMPEIKEKAEKLGIADKVIFAGNHADVSDFYQAMDYLVFPSHFEGLPGTIVEAQAAGLRCLLSDAITPEVLVTKLATSYSLHKPAKEWADYVIAHKDYERTTDATALKAAGFDVKEQVLKLQDFYMGKKRRLLLIVPMLHQGGFERVCVRTARMLAEECQVTILIFNDADLAFDIEGLEVININVKSQNGKLRKLWNVWQRVCAVKQIKEERRIDIAYSFGVTANLVNVFAKTAAKCWVGLRGYTDLYSKTLPIICSRADKIVCCSQTIEKTVSEKFAEKDVIALPNSYDIEKINQKAMEEIAEEDEKIFAGHPVVIGVGREDDLKGFWHLIRCFTRVIKKVPNARLLIVGEGEYLEDKKFAKDLGIGDKVFFTGVRENPFPYIKKSTIFVLSSRNEGFPNALVEAMALGKPVIATNCKSGPSEILMKDYNEALDNRILYEADYGVLLPIILWDKDLRLKGLDVNEIVMADEIIEMLQHRERQEMYGKLAREGAERFSDARYKKTILENMENTHFV